MAEAQSPRSASATDNEQNEDGYATMFGRYIRQMAPTTLLTQTALVTNCCECLPQSDDAAVTSVLPSPKDRAAEGEGGNCDGDKTITSEGGDEVKRVVVMDDMNNSKTVHHVVVNLPSIEIGGREVAFKDTSSRMRSMRSLSFHDDHIDPEVTERAMLIFIENSISLAKRAVSDNKVILADKLICGMLKRIRDVYGVNESEYVKDTKVHPFVNMMDKLPKEVPASVRDAVGTIAGEKLFITSLAEKILVLDLIEKFNLTCMKAHIQNYRQRFLAKLWPSAIETAYYEMKRGEANTTTDDDDVVAAVDNSGVIENKIYNEHLYGPNIVERSATKQVQLYDAVVNDDKKHLRKPSRYLAYASRIIASRKNTMFGQHFSKNKVRTADGWVKEPYRTLETYYRFEGNGSVSVKVRGKLSTDLMRVLCIINETDLSPEWVPFLKEASTLHVFSRTTKMFQQQYEYPVVGIKNTSVFGIAINALDESGCFILSCRGPPETKKDVEQLASVLHDGGMEDVTPFVSFEGNTCRLWGEEVQPIQPKVRQKSADLCFLLYPMAEHTLVELCANITPEVRLVPSRIVTYIIKKVVVTIFKKIAQISKNFSESPFAARMQQNVEFYDWVARLLGEYRGKDERQNCNISISTYDTSCNDA